jgi:tetratricopeptide (TPR) repeat protein
LGDLRDHLNDQLSESYVIDRELGGGGMSRVFLAEERALGRRVVLKVLPAELAAGVSAERFAREVRLAANLQHPCIVPVLSAGSAGDVSYYTMPFVEGESLRVQMNRGAVSLGESVKILRDMASAMAYAHGRGIVHRDIKPENVLLSGGYALVADFGIAKAVEGARTLADATPGATITQLGTAIGTPAYMAPEQAAGDPSTDHRADVYAWGMVAYELLGGVHPFASRTSAHALLAAQMSERPASLVDVRSNVPSPLASLVSRCLEKDPALRPRSAEELVRDLDGAATPTESRLDTRSLLIRAIGVYVAAFVVAVIVAKAAIIGIGLPSWVLTGIIIVMLLGLPVIVFTGYVKYAAQRGPTVTPGGTATNVTRSAFAERANQQVTWRRAALGGMWAVGAFIALVAGYMLLRAFGIGPAGSLLAAGLINDRDQILVAQFSTTTGDSLLSRAVVEAIRTDLGQSNVVTLMPASAVRQTLALMEKPPTTFIDSGVARVIAARAGVKAVLGGDIAQLGPSYVLTARLLAPSTGDVLAAFRETAVDARGVLPAVERLSRALRAKLGESLKRIQRDPPLSQVTTPSLEALRLYAQGAHVGDDLGDVDRGQMLVKQALAHDSMFAMAWRKLGVWANNRTDANAGVYAKRAAELADRLPTSEKYSTLASYHMALGDGYDVNAAIAALREGLSLDSTNATLHTNLASRYAILDNLDSAIANARIAAKQGEGYAAYYLEEYFIQTGHRAEADSMVVESRRVAPGWPYRILSDIGAPRARQQYDSAESVGRAAKTFIALAPLASIQLERGELRAAKATLRAMVDSASARGNAGAALHASSMVAWASVILGKPDPATAAAAAADLDAAEKAFPIEQQPLPKRPYYVLAAAYVAAGRINRAKTLIQEGDRRYSRGLANYYRDVGAVAKGMTALAEGRASDAVVALSVGSQCGGMDARPRMCLLPFLGMAYDRAGQTDSARAVLRRYVDRPSEAVNELSYGLTMGPSLQRLGELDEAKGDLASAIKTYERLIDLWKNADADLAPRVEDIRRRVERLKAVEGRKR